MGGEHRGKVEGNNQPGVKVYLYPAQELQEFRCGQQYPEGNEQGYYLLPGKKNYCGDRQGKGGADNYATGKAILQ